MVGSLFGFVWVQFEPGRHRGFGGEERGETDDTRRAREAATARLHACTLHSATRRWRAHASAQVPGASQMARSGSPCSATPPRAAPRGTHGHGAPSRTERRTRIFFSFCSFAESVYRALGECLPLLLAVLVLAFTVAPHLRVFCEGRDSFEGRI